MHPTLHIHLLGNFLLAMDDTPITTINSSRLQSLLAYLLLHRGAPQGRSHVAFLLWPDAPEERAHASLRKLLHQLRQALPDIDQFLHIDRQSLYWSPPTDVAWTLDIQDMEHALALAKQAEQDQHMTTAREALENAVALYHGDLLPACYDEWILPERDHLRSLFLLAAEQLIGLLEKERAYAAAISVAQQLLRHDSLHEATYRQLMRLHALLGDRAAALRVYHTCVTVLERELGVGPGETTQEVYESLLQANSSSGTSPTLIDTQSARVVASPLLGRKAEWRQLQEIWRTISNEHAHVVMLTGEAGIGKTRLAEEMEAWVNRQGMTTASARCYAAFGQLTYAPIASWLRTDAMRDSLSALNADALTEIARLMPELLAKHPQLPHPAAMTEGWQRQHFFEAIARVVLHTHQPLLLMLDDIQWCDQETLEWLHYLLRFAPTARLLLLGTIRIEEASPDHPLVTFLRTLQRDHLLTEIALGPLTTGETTTLAEHIVGHPLDLSTSNMLYAETEGNPLFIVEMAQVRTREQDTPFKMHSSLSLLTGSTSTLPPSVQTVLAARLAQLSPLAQDVANVAAIIGREFTFPVLARASGEREDAVVRGLNELWQKRIVREQGAATAETYDFSHDKLREQVYTSLSPTYRRLLHRHVAEALEELHAHPLDVLSGQIAMHYERAGLPMQAISYYQRAGASALRLYANREAKNAFEHAAALLELQVQHHTQQELAWEITVQIYESLGDANLEIGCYAEARQAYQQALTFLLSQVSLWSARLQRKIANSWNHISTNQHDVVHIQAREAFQEAERILTQLADPLCPEWRVEWIELQFAQIWPLRGSVDDMTAILDKMQPLIEQYATKEQRDRFLFATVTRDIIRGHYTFSENIMSFLQTGIPLAQQAGDQNKLGILSFVLGLALLQSGQFDEAEQRLEQAIHVGEQMGVIWLQVRCLTFLPFIYRRRGQVEQVRNTLSRAQAIGAVQHNRILIGQCAWLAWRDGNLSDAETYGRESIEEKQQQDVNAFSWVGIWPLLGIALKQEKIADAISYIRLLLAPAQQPPPDNLKTMLETAIQAWDTDKHEEVEYLLSQIVPLAEQMGYL